MDKQSLEKYAYVLTTYCCDVKPGDRVLIRSTYLAEPLILACQKQVLLMGATCEFDISINHVAKQKYDHSSIDALKTPPIIYKHAVEMFDVVISISAPFGLFELKDVDEKRLALGQSALKSIKTTMMNRGKSGQLRWVICNYPTESLAAAAKMTLDDYSSFIVSGCFLDKENPIQEWESLAKRQEQYVTTLNKGQQIQFISDSIDLSFDISDRIWINSDGRRNMPSGEVFTSPVETSGHGKIVFDHPSILFGQEVVDLKLTLKDGIVVGWESKSSQTLLDQLFTIDGANKIGEIAIGTNDAIQQPTLNTLFDEKIGGTIHMAVGASYPETGGKNQSSIHHDFVTSFSSNSKNSFGWPVHLPKW